MTTAKHVAEIGSKTAWGGQAWPAVDIGAMPPVQSGGRATAAKSPVAAKGKSRAAKTPTAKPASKVAGPATSVPTSNSSASKLPTTSVKSIRTHASHVELNSEAASRQAQLAVVACDLAMKNLKAGSESARRLSSRLGEISRKTTKLPTYSADAQVHVSHCRADVDEIVDVGKRLEKVIKGMTATARRVSALSFTATMEASRPGGGNSFAVIANELQSLSRRLTRTGKLARRDLAVLQSSVRSIEMPMETAGESLAALNEEAAELGKTIAEQRNVAETAARDLADTLNALSEVVTACGRLSDSTRGCSKDAKALQEMSMRLSSDSQSEPVGTNRGRRYGYAERVEQVKVEQ